jgi:anaerobic selenocysteine-containing dehydrogenase
MIISRRTFFAKNAVAAGALGALALASHTAQAQAAVLESDAQAQALGYKADGSKVDTKKHPNYAANQSCSGCALFQGKATDSTGSCAVFANKLVSSKGWCGAWSKKA